MSGLDLRLGVDVGAVTRGARRIAHGRSVSSPASTHRWLSKPLVAHVTRVGRGGCGLRCRGNQSGAGQAFTIWRAMNMAELLVASMMGLAVAGIGWAAVELERADRATAPAVSPLTGATRRES